MANQMQPATDAIRELGGWDPEGATDLHETIRTLSGISEAAGGAYRQIADTLDDAGVHSNFPEQLRESAGTVGEIANKLEGHLEGGLMSQNGKSEGDSARVRGVISTVEDLGRWEPGDPEDLHETISMINEVTGAVRDSYSELAKTVHGTGAHESYPPALGEAAGGLGSVADELEHAFSEGVMRRPG